MKVCPPFGVDSSSQESPALPGTTPIRGYLQERRPELPSNVRTLVVGGLILVGGIVSILWERQRSAAEARIERPPAAREVVLDLRGTVQAPVGATTDQATLLLHFPELPCDVTVFDLKPGKFQQKLTLKTSPDRLPASVRVEARLSGCQSIVLRGLQVDRDPLSLQLPVLEFKKQAPSPAPRRVSRAVSHKHH